MLSQSSMSWVCFSMSMMSWVCFSMSMMSYDVLHVVYDLWKDTSICLLFVCNCCSMLLLGNVTAVFTTAKPVDYPLRPISFNCVSIACLSLVLCCVGVGGPCCLWCCIDVGGPCCLAAVASVCLITGLYRRAHSTLARTTCHAVLQTMVLAMLQYI